MASEKLTRLDSLEEVEALMRGDVIKVEYLPFHSDPENLIVAVQTPGIPERDNLFQLIMPHPADKKIIRMYSIIQRRFGFNEAKKILQLDEDYTNIQNHPMDNPNLASTLKYAGLIQ